MFIVNAVLGKVARNVAFPSLFGNESRQQLISAYFAQLNKRVPMYLNMLKGGAGGEDKNSRTTKWDEDDLKLQLSEEKKTLNPLDSEKWIQFYKFKHIVLTRTVVRLKFYQAAISTSATIAYPLLRSFDIEIPEDMLLLGVGLNIYALAISLLLGMGAQQVVGILYVNDRKDRIRVARLSFLGHRVDTLLELNDVMHAGDVGGKYRFPYVMLTRYSDPEAKAVVFTNPGSILDVELFEEVFGPIPQPPPEKVTK